MINCLHALKSINVHVKNNCDEFFQTKNAFIALIFPVHTALKNIHNKKIKRK